MMSFIRFWSNLGSLRSALVLPHAFPFGGGTYRAPEKVAGIRELRFLSIAVQASGRNSEDGNCIKLLDGSPKSKLKQNENQPGLRNIEAIQQCNVSQGVTDARKLSQPVTVIVFDIETTGFSRKNDRIIEFALQDLLGGRNSTFQTLINPGRDVPNFGIHGISSSMVNHPEVPRWEELVPILLNYVRSRQKPGGLVLWVAHNGRRFDVPFLINEFRRCSKEIPYDWLFLDTLCLARLLVKLDVFLSK